MAIKINAPIETHPTMEQMMPSSEPAAADIECRRLAELNGMSDEEAWRNPEIRAHLRPMHYSGASRSASCARGRRCGRPDSYLQVSCNG